MTPVSNFHTLNLGRKSTSVWLVKIPKYIDDKWKKAPRGVEVAKLKVIKKAKTETKCIISLSEHILNMADDEYLPVEHELQYLSVKNQSIAAFSEEPCLNKKDKLNKSTSDSNQLKIEGKVTQKLSCRPTAMNAKYLKMTKDKIKKANSNEKQIHNLDRILPVFKPVSNHKHLIELKKKKKMEGRVIRLDKEQVREMMFKAFSQHQYYSTDDLVLITKQPRSYVAEILKEMAKVNLSGPFKFKWELKQEYKHYQVKNDTTIVIDDSD